MIHPEKTRVRFWSKVQKEPGPCWNWTGAIKGNGYGTFRLSASEGMAYAHRVAWELTHGQISAGLYVCHTCDNRRCCNPEHLWLGTHQENQADMGAKGRTFSPAKKLTDDDVRNVREALGKGETHASIASRFGVERSLITRIKTGNRRGGV